MPERHALTFRIILENVQNPDFFFFVVVPEWEGEACLS